MKKEIITATLNLTPMDRQNRIKIEAALLSAAETIDADHWPILVFPELTLTGHCDDFFRARWLREKALDDLFALTEKTKGLTALVGLPLEVAGSVYNAAALLENGAILGFSLSTVQKTSNPDAARWFESWPRGTETAVELRGKSYRAGDLIYNSAAGKIAVEFAPLESENSRGETIILVPGASAFELGKYERLQQSLLDFSAKRGVILAFANQNGIESGGTLYDGGSFIADRGKLTVREQRLFFGEDTLASSIFGDGGQHLGGRTADAQEWSESTGETLVFEEFSRAVPLALFDYLRKCRAGGFVLSLSGGADSGAIAVLIRLMIKFGLGAFGPERLLQTFPAIKKLENLLESLKNQDAKKIGALDERQIAAAFLTTVYQGSANSGNVTRTAARKVAEAVGSVHYEFNIAPLVDSYRKMIEESIGRPLSWETDDLALQNIQARVRAPGAWLLANLTGALFLSTGNRSEAACGYATMDGDSCGAISPIAGVSKAFLRRWLRWMESVGPRLQSNELSTEESKRGETRFPVPALSFINAQQPTAELRPPEAGQTDEADLMPYSVLEIIELGAIFEKLCGTELLDFVRERAQKVPELSEADDALLSTWIEKFWRLWRHSQWKRERFALGFHLDACDLSAVRFPVLTAAY